MIGIVIDTNVVFSALRSQAGASYKLVSMIGTEKFLTFLSVPLLFEYEAVLKRSFLSIPTGEVDDFLDYICAVSKHVRIHYLWRPHLKDPNDELVLELAVAAKVDFVVTYNQRDFKGIERFDIKAITPKEFLSFIGAIK